MWKGYTNKMKFKRIGYRKIEIKIRQALQNAASCFQNDIIFYKCDHFIQLSVPNNESEDIYINNRYDN
jgi:hypothetical protein